MLLEGLKKNKFRALVPFPSRSGGGASIYRNKMNKLKWFTHDNDAHEDLFIQDVMDKFGHFGYAAYFMLIEVLDRHGKGDILTISRKGLAKKLRCKPKSLVNVLGMFRESKRVLWEGSGEILTIEIPKFRKRQSKLKSKVRATFPQSSLNVPQEGEREGEREKNNKLAGKARRKSEPEKKKPQKRGAFHEFMDRFLRHYFDAPIGVDTKEARSEVKALYSRYGRAGRDILALAGGDIALAIKGVDKIGRYFDGRGLSWKLDTIANRFAEWKVNPKEFENENNRNYR